MCAHEKLRTEVLLPQPGRAEGEMPRPFSTPLPQAQAPGAQTAAPPPHTHTHTTFPQEISGNKCSRKAARAEVRKKNVPMPKEKTSSQGRLWSLSFQAPWPRWWWGGGCGKNGHRAGRGLGKSPPCSVPDSPVQGIDSRGRSRAPSLACAAEQGIEGRYQASSRDKVRLSRTLRQFLNKIQIPILAPRQRTGFGSSPNSGC